jgi:hypothetical protein
MQIYLQAQLPKKGLPVSLGNGKWLGLKISMKKS